MDTRLSITLSIALLVLGDPARGISGFSPQESSGATRLKSETRVPTLFVIGDSTVNNSTKEQMGWGTPIAAFFDDKKINVENRARGGRSSRTYMTEGLWDQVLAEIKPGDFVLMQFGHNDGGAINDTSRARGSIRGTGDETQEIDNLLTKKHEVVHTYGWYLRKYIADTKAKRATPILLSLVPRNIWKDGKVVGATDDYGKWAAQAAKAENAFFVDLNEIVARHYESAGQSKVQAEYFTTTDHTHTTPAGAWLNAASVVEGLRELKGCPLSTYLLSPSAQQPGTAPSVATQQLPRSEFPLWAEGAPGALGKEAKDVPTLTPYFAPSSKATGAAIIICPGGAYGALAPHEGVHYALWLNEQGITGFVLKYRLGTAGYKHPAMMQDVLRGIRYVRASAEKWKLDSNRIGVMGSSAGGHLAATALTHFDAGDPNAPDPIDRVSSRPSLGILCYPVITMGSNTHSGSKRNLLGDDPNQNLVEFLSNEKQVTRDTPPTFIFHTFEDATVKVENSLEFAAALRHNGVPFSLHIYPKGGHGMGLGGSQWDPENRHPWTTQCAIWLKEQRFGNGVSARDAR